MDQSGKLITSDADLQAAMHDASASGKPTALYYQPANAIHPALQSTEEVSFVPHPKTMTMAGVHLELCPRTGCQGATTRMWL